MTDGFATARQALDRAHVDGRRIAVWLRDDDCIAVTPRLERLAALCAAVGLPILLAVIPEPAEPGLAAWVARQPTVAPCQHGFAHADHAAPGERARELGGRPIEAILAELTHGRARLSSLFGPRLADTLVPPWNRIEPDLVPRLAGLGYTALSCFAPTPSTSPIPRLDCDLDIVDWRGGRVGRPLDDLARKVAAILATGDRIGILTHHLAHDETAWSALGDMLRGLSAHPAVDFTDAATLLGRSR